MMFKGGIMNEKNYNVVILVVVITFSVVSGEFALMSDVVSLPPEISALDYLGFSVVGIALNLLLALVLYIEYRISEENAGEFYFSVAFLSNAVYILSSCCAVLLQEQHHMWVEVKDVYISYFFRQFNFVIMSFLAVKITTRCERRFYHRLTRYFALLVFWLMFIAVMYVWNYGGVLENNAMVFSFYPLYILIGLWVLVFIMTIGENRIKPECRELLMFFALSGVVCNLMMTAVATGTSYPWYLSKIIDAISLLIVGGVLLGRLMEHIKQAGSALHRDAVTGVYSRKYFYSNMSIIQGCTSGHIQHFIIICSIDNLREINQVRGEEFGDYILKNIANVLLMHSGEMDIVARTGGRTFVALLHETDEANGIRCYNRIRAGILSVARNTGVLLNIKINYQVFQGDEEHSVGYMENKNRMTDVSVCK